MKFCIIALSIVVLTSCKPIVDSLYEGRLLKYIDEKEETYLVRDSVDNYLIWISVWRGEKEALESIYYDKINKIIYWRVNSDKNKPYHKRWIYIYDIKEKKHFWYKNNGVFEERDQDYGLLNINAIPSKTIQQTIHTQIKFTPIKDFWNGIEPKTSI